jgi:hypothetical protein
MADITSRMTDAFGKRVVLTVDMERMVNVLADHVPVIEPEGGGFLFGCSCGWNEEYEAITTTGKIIREVAEMAAEYGFVGWDAVTLPEVIPPDDEVVVVPSPNPMASHYMEVIVGSAVSRQISGEYGSGRVQ